MNNLGWENPAAIRTEISLPPPSIYWSNHYDNFTVSGEGYSSSSSSSFFNECLLGSSSSELHRIMGSDVDRISESVEISGPASHSINNSLDLDLLQYREAIASAKTNNGKRKFEEFETVRENRSYVGSVLRSNSSAREGGSHIHFAREPKSKEPRPEKGWGGSSIVDFVGEDNYEPDTEAMAELKEMVVYKSAAAALRPPVRLLGTEDATKKPKRKNVRISSDPQTVAARQRRERISERLRTLQRLVPGGSKLDIASVLDEAANYLKFLKSQVKVLETLGNGSDPANGGSSSSTAVTPKFPVPLNQAFPVPPPKTLNAFKEGGRQS